MFYTFGAAGIKRQDIAKWKKNSVCTGYFTLTELKKYEEKFQISLKALESSLNEPVRFRTGMKLYDGLGFGVIQLIHIRNVKREAGRLAFFLKQDMFLVVELCDPQGSLRQQFSSIMELERQNVTLEKVVFDYLETFLKDAGPVLEETEQTIIDMERRLVEGKIDKNLNKRIFEMKRRLTIQKNYFRQLGSIGAVLAENENKIFWQEDFQYFKLYADKAERLTQSTKQLCEDLIHVREALDAALDYNLNSIMKVFTVVTTIFMPLTLITGWYGMNFANMPELTWAYGYPAVMAAALVVVAGCLGFFKWKKLL